MNDREFIFQFGYRDRDEVIHGDDLLKLIDFVDKLGIAVEQETPEIFVRTRMARYLAKYGVTTAFRSGRLEEAVLPDGMGQVEREDVLRYHLKMTEPEQELLIIDPYIFNASTKSDPNYIPFVESVFSETLGRISRLHVATLPGHDPGVLAAFEAMVKNHNRALTPVLKSTNVFHDRFWVVDQEKGIVIGTSLNGIGKRYALIDWVAEEDTKAIYQRYLKI